MRNASAPINKIPPEILALVPDFLDHEDTITLTHVCETWRDVFVSQSSLWTYFDCKNVEKTRIYLERSNSSPIHLFFTCKSEVISPHDPFFQITPHDIVRLKSLSVEGTPTNMRGITSHLSHPAPLLEYLSIDAGNLNLIYRPQITSTLLNGDLSSLRTLHLKFVQTDLPWRNMVNLTSFTLFSPSLEPVSVRQLLDFFESTPHLCRVELRHAMSKNGVQNGQLVSLACLKSMIIDDFHPPALLDHLLIPAGAELEIRGYFDNSPIGALLPRSLNNLENFSNVTKIQLYFLDQPHVQMIFSGPNGRVDLSFRTSQADPTNFLLESLAQFDNSKTEWLEIYNAGGLSKVILYRTLLPMADLRTLTLSKCTDLDTFIHTLQPSMSLSEVMVCPRLEEFTLVLGFYGISDTTELVEMAAARASRGNKLRTIGIIDTRRYRSNLDVSELKEHVCNVEYDRGVGMP